jgi:hypothetical protein
MLRFFAIDGLEELQTHYEMKGHFCGLIASQQSRRRRILHVPPLKRASEFIGQSSLKMNRR